MPLRAHRADGTFVTSCFLSDDEWEEIRRSKGKHGLLMPNGTPAVAKVSPTGLRFFAHKSGAGSQTAPESIYHLAAKSIIAEAAVDAGWDVTVEAPGTAPTGEEWVADVLCVKGKARVAFEVQWSNQTEEDMHERQRIYARSGIRGLWLVRLSGRGRLSDHPKLPATTQECPAFGIRDLGGSDEFEVLLEALDEYAFRRMSLSDFIRGALSGDLSWWSYMKWSQESGIAPLSILSAEINCWSCRQKLIFPFSITPMTTCFLSYNFEHLFDDIRDLQYELARLNGDSECLLPVARIEYRYSRRRGKKAIMGACPWCTISLGIGYAARLRSHQATFYSAVIHVSSQSVRKLPEGCGWWNEEGWTWGRGAMPEQTELMPERRGV